MITIVQNQLFTINNNMSQENGDRKSNGKHEYIQQNKRFSTNKLTSTFDSLRRKCSNRRSSWFPYDNSAKAVVPSQSNSGRRSLGLPIVTCASAPSGCCIVPMSMRLDRPVLMMDEIGFSSDELNRLRKQFECLKQQRDEVAGEILKCIKLNFKINHNLDAHHNKWSTLGLGVTLLSGFERVINRLDKPQHLSQLMKYIVKSHDESNRASTSEMRRLVAVSQHIVMPYICPCRQSSSNQLPTKDCEIHDLWSKFFLLVIGLISSAQVQLEQEEN